MRILYTRAIAQPGDEDVAVLLPGRELFARDLLAGLSGEKPVVSPPFLENGYLCMTYRDRDQTVTQRACFLPKEGFSSLSRGDDAAVFNTPFGRAALAVYYDIFQPQYARLCALRGCQILFAALPPASEHLILAGPWSAAQANNLAVSVAFETGGQLLVPCSLTRDNSGYAAANCIELPLLAQSYAAFPVFDSFNRDFCARYREALR